MFISVIKNQLFTIKTVFSDRYTLMIPMYCWFDHYHSHSGLVHAAYRILKLSMGCIIKKAISRNMLSNFTHQKLLMGNLPKFSSTKYFCYTVTYVYDVARNTYLAFYLLKCLFVLSQSLLL